MAYRDITQIGTKPTNAASPKGPLAALYGSDKYSFQSHIYPQNLGSDGRGHYINFYINVNNAAQYQGSMKWKIAQNTQGVAQGNLKPSSPLLSESVVGKNIADSVNAIQTNVLGRNTKRITQAISMYMPDQAINADYNINWQSTSLTDALGKAGLFGQAGKALGDLAGAISTDGLQGAIRDVSTNPFAAEIAGMIGSNLGVTGQSAGDFLMYASGQALNPQLEVLFKGIGFRNFQFVFYMSPKSPQEAQNCLEIIKTFKFHASPEISLRGGRYWIMPSEFDIQFIHNGQENTNINKISTCVLEQIQVQYANNGNWSTFYDGVPTQIMLTLQFMEVEQMTRQRIDEGY